MPRSSRISAGIGVGLVAAFISVVVAASAGASSQSSTSAPEKHSSVQKYETIDTEGISLRTAEGYIECAVTGKKSQYFTCMAKEDRESNGSWAKVNLDLSRGKSIRAGLPYGDLVEIEDVTGEYYRLRDVTTTYWRKGNIDDPVIFDHDRVRMFNFHGNIVWANNNRIYFENPYYGAKGFVMDDAFEIDDMKTEVSGSGNRGGGSSNSSSSTSGTRTTTSTSRSTTSTTSSSPSTTSSSASITRTTLSGPSESSSTR